MGRLAERQTDGHWCCIRPYKSGQNRLYFTMLKLHVMIVTLCQRALSLAQTRAFLWSYFRKKLKGVEKIHLVTTNHIVRKDQTWATLVRGKNINHWTRWTPLTTSFTVHIFWFAKFTGAILRAVAVQWQCYWSSWSFIAMLQSLCNTSIVNLCSKWNMDGCVNCRTVKNCVSGMLQVASVKRLD